MSVRWSSKSTRPVRRGGFGGHVRGRAGCRSLTSRLRLSILGEQHRRGLFVRAADLFGQAPVEHPPLADFAVVTQDDVLRLQVAVNDAA